MNILYTLLSVIIGGLFNRLRGGWLYDLGLPLPKIVLRSCVALFSTACLYLPFWLNHAFNSTDYLWAGGVFLCFLMFGLIPGWGSWFSIGREETSYRHNRDWILSEVLTRIIYGKKWVPSKEVTTYADYAPVPETYRTVKFPEDEHLLKRFNYMLSPTGYIRDAKWRRNMEFTAMNIRGLNITVPAMIVYAIHLKPYINNDYIVGIIMASGYCFGNIYELGHKIDISKLPNWARYSTAFGEIISGATIMSSVLMLGSYLILM